MWIIRKAAYCLAVRFYSAKNLEPNLLRNHKLGSSINKNYLYHIIEKKREFFQKFSFESQKQKFGGKRKKEYFWEIWRKSERNCDL